MALNPKTAVLVRNGALDFLTSHIGASPVMRWYDGTQPTDADTALSSNTLIVTLACSATLAAAASAGSITLNAITGANAVATGNPVSWGSLLTSAFVRKLDFTIAASGANLNLNSATVGSGAACSVSSFTVSMAA
jgi:hypothetical protein